MITDIIIRRAKDTDDLVKIASCIYLTDPYIYPAAFGDDMDQAAYTIAELMKIKNGLFHPDNIILAICGDDICGTILYNKDGALWNHSELSSLLEGTVPDINNFDYVSKNYFSIEALVPEKGYLEIIACCIIPNYRNMGIGKTLMGWFVNEYPEHNLTLDVLSDNKAAICVYQKCGFEIIEKTKGFGLEESTRPACYKMVRNMPARK